MAERLSGPIPWPRVTGWHLLDLDHDFDVDLRDYVHWQDAFAGQGE
jgi:hypothetical protein